MIQQRVWVWVYPYWAEYTQWSLIKAKSLLTGVLLSTNTWIDLLQAVQEGSSIMTLMTEQETMKQDLL